MPVLTRLVSSPLIVHVRGGALDDLGTLLADQRIATTGRLAIAASEGSGATLRHHFAPQLPGARWFPVPAATLDAAVDLADAVRASGPCDAVVGLGGGKIIDVTKYAAARLGLPMVAVATNLAHDGIASPVSILDNDAGRGSYGVPMPIGLVVDLDVVRQAPPRSVRSGIGEVLSNLSAIADWRLSAEETGEPVDGLALAMARTAAESVLHRGDGVEHDEFLTVLAEALVLSGMAMSVAGTTRPASGACHEISHALRLLYQDKDTGLHGEQVGLGAAFAWHLRDEGARAMEMVDVLRQHQLPAMPADLGLTAEQFVAAVMRAPETRPGRYTILEHLNLDESALRKAVDSYVDTYGD